MRQSTRAKISKTRMAMKAQGQEGRLKTPESAEAHEAIVVMETLEAKYEVDVDNEQVIDSIPLPPSWLPSFLSRL